MVFFALGVDVNLDNLFKARKVRFRGKSEASAEALLQKHLKSLRFSKGFGHRGTTMRVRGLLINLMQGCP